jgi:hypothetical protein
VGGRASSVFIKVRSPLRTSSYFLVFFPLSSPKSLGFSPLLSLWCPWLLQMVVSTLWWCFSFMISVPSGCSIDGISLRGMIVLALKASSASFPPSCGSTWTVACLRLSPLFATRPTAVSPSGRWIWFLLWRSMPSSFSWTAPLARRLSCPPRILGRIELWRNV